MIRRSARLRKHSGAKHEAFTKLNNINLDICMREYGDADHGLAYLASVHGVRMFRFILAF
jgi:hypothetical protein